jgi:hypothetical protein
MEEEGKETVPGQKCICESVAIPGITRVPKGPALSMRKKGTGDPVFPDPDIPSGSDHLSGLRTAMDSYHGKGTGDPGQITPKSRPDPITFTDCVQQQISLRNGPGYLP